MDAPPLMARTPPVTLSSMNARDVNLALPADPKREDFADIQTALRVGS